MNCRHAASTWSAESACERSGPPPFFIILAGFIVLQTSPVLSFIIIAVGFSPAAAGRQIMVAILCDAIASWLIAFPLMASSASASPGIASAAQANAAESNRVVIVSSEIGRVLAPRSTVPHLGRTRRKRAYEAAQNARLVSSRIVTGPSFTSSTAMSAPKTPVSTRTPV